MPIKAIQSNINTFIKNGLKLKNYLDSLSPTQQAVYFLGKEILEGDGYLSKLIRSVRQINFQTQFLTESLRNIRIEDYINYRGINELNS